MRSTNTFGIHFILRMNKCKDGKAPIYVRITANQTRCELATKKTITPKDWNSAKGMTKPKSEELKVVNSYLEQVRSQLVDHYQKLQIATQTITAEAIKNSYLGTEKEHKTLCTLIKYHNEHMATVLAKGTLKNYYTTEKYIRLFLQKNYKVKDYGTPQRSDSWLYDYRTNVHHTLKKNPLKLDDLKDFIDCYNPKNRHKRKETFNATTNPEGRFRKFTYDEIVARDKTSLDISWLKDKSLADLDNLPDPDVLALDIVENLEAGLDSFRRILVQLNN